MVDSRIEDLHILKEERLPSPDLIKQELPLTEESVQTTQRGQQTIRAILDGKDPRLFLVVGPCSIHDPQSALEYAKHLKVLADEVQDTLFLVMRTYFEKPRTSVGWQGLIHDPDLDQSFHIEKGLRVARKLLLDITTMGLPTAGEALNLIIPQYHQDLYSWTAIGARTTEAQTHRKLAGGLSNPVGFKNNTHGDIDVAVNAILSAQTPDNFLSVDRKGVVAVIRTKGNAYTHVVLRGGQTPNYDAESIQHTESLLQQANLAQNIMVDCSHANSGKEHLRQLEVIDNLTYQIQQGNSSIIGLMIESHLHAGSQSMSGDLSNLKYGVSITDKCLDWESTRQAILEFARQLKPLLFKRQRFSQC